MWWKIFACCIFQYFYTQVECLSALTSGPSSLNVSVNSLAMFSCIASNVDLVVWFMNESTINCIPNLIEEQTPPVNLDETTAEYNMSFSMNDSLDLGLLNNTLVTCVGFKQQKYGIEEATAPSPPAVLLIQGLS